VGSDFTLFAKADGVVQFEGRRLSVVPAS